MSCIKNVKLLTVLICFLVFHSCNEKNNLLEIYVDIQGGNRNKGSINEPFNNLNYAIDYIHNLNKNGLPINPVPTILETLYNTEGIRITNIRSILWRPSYFHRKILKYLTNGVKIIYLKIPLIKWNYP